ncbi:MAG: hypothetical protein Hyperionvirus4_124 [Hyperionvirus sp.]|uniref:Uncharacterized protein n=1 Tax=Hyperionvirus sp. TaxID=2487770 RepID=A0A3G5ACT7_9VIRU|nr:MAG: hypothetical protein Hyperionvirus4_124 [Hyperionvirus sp.]
MLFILEDSLIFCRCSCPMAVRLVGFSLRTVPAYPVYSLPRENIVLGPLDNLGASIEDLAVVVNGTPETIGGLDETEVVRLRSIARGSWVSRPSCPQRELVRDDLTKNPFVGKVYMMNHCFCCHSSTATVLRGTSSWSCVFCAYPICNERCYSHHFRGEHDGWNGRISKPFDLSLVSGEWCPLCRKVIRKGPLSSDEMNWRSLDLFDCANYAIKNTVCSDCSQWDEKKLLAIPDSLVKQLEGTAVMHFYPLGAPPYVFQPEMRFRDLGRLASYDEHPGFLVELLKRGTFEEVNELLLVDRFNFQSYICEVWKQMLSIGRRDEVRPIPGGKILAAIQTEIASLEACVVEMGIVREVGRIICEYASSLRNLERLLYQVQSDAVRYAPSLASLIVLIGKIE